MVWRLGRQAGVWAVAVPLVLTFLLSACGGSTSTASRPSPSARAATPHGGRAGVHVPILMYHYVGQVPPRDSNPQLRAGLTVSPQAFLQQVQWLQANGYHSIDAGQLDGYFEGRNDLPAKPVMLTFDDGNADLYTAAYPVLRQYHMLAVAYIVSGFLGAQGRVTAAQVSEMSRNGIEIGSHTFNHEDLTREAPDRLHMELTRSKQTLEHLTGHPVRDFAYPAGRYNRTVQAAVQRVGYASAMASDQSPQGGASPSTAEGSQHTWSDRFAWARLEVNGHETLQQFIASLGRPE